MEILWFIPGHGDTRFLGTQTSRRHTTHAYLAQVAQAADALGFTGALLPTGQGCEDSWVLASSLIALTKRLKFLIAIRPGSLSPTLAARMAATFDRLSNGRLLLNIITGGDPKELAGDGTFLSHDERYVVTDEFLAIWRDLFTGESTSFEGKYEHIEGGKLALPPVQRPYPPLYFGGSSPAAIEVASKHIDTYLSLGEPPQEIAKKFDAVREAAQRHGRQVKFGVRLHIVVREKTEDAWAAAEDLLRYADADVIAQNQAKLAQFDSVGQSRMRQLHNGGRESLEISPNLWAGFGLVNKGLGTALVGDPDTIAERLQEYVDLGVESFVLSGYTHLEEAYRVAELVFPRLPWWKPIVAEREEVFQPSKLPNTWQ
jgi:alkanesulfonate monooxygenase